jgi:hypothetical protein
VGDGAILTSAVTLGSSFLTIREELWSPWFSTWFPQGLKEPNLALLKVSVETAEYWDAPSSTMVNLYGVVKATLTGKGSQAGEHAKLVVDERQAGT